MVYRFWTVIIAALFLTADPAWAKDIKDYDPLFSSDETLEVVLEGPFAFLLL